MEKPSQPHRIIILTALNGFKVKVGCAEILFTNATDLLNELGRYLRSPDEVEKEYMEEALYSQSPPDACETESTPEDDPSGNATQEPRVTRGIDEFVGAGRAD